MTLALVLTHLLAAYAVLAMPWLGRIWYQKARRRIESGLPDAKARLYRNLVVEQIVTAGAVLTIWRGACVPAVSLGLIAPRWLPWSTAALSVFVVTLAWSSFRMRPKAEKIRRRLKDSVGALLPESQPDRFWWGAVSVGAGISEELVFRGFLLYYFSVYLPQLNALEKVLLASLIFGFAHIYQGWKPAIGTGVLGLVFAGLYLMTGSLLVPIVIHAAVDYRVLLIFPPNVSPTTALESNA